MIQRGLGPDGGEGVAWMLKSMVVMVRAAAWLGASRFLTGIDSRLAAYRALRPAAEVATAPRQEAGGRRCFTGSG
jgi:hypothetical protein